MGEYAPEVCVKNGEEDDETQVRWSKKKNGDLSHTFDAGRFNVTEDVTVYTVSAKITITWDGNGGKFRKGSSRNITFTYMDNVTPANGFARDGYALKGWSKTKKKQQILDFTNVHATEDTTYYAVWEKAAGSVTIDTNGLGWFEGVQTDSIISDDKKTLTKFLGRGMSLDGMLYDIEGKDDIYDPDNSGLSLSPDGPAIYTASYEPTGDMKLYVVKRNINVTVDPNGGAYEGGDKYKYKYRYSKGELFRGVPFADPVKKGSTFAGWFTAPKGGKQIVPGRTKITKKMTVYAHWKNAKNVKVTFDVNGGRYDTSKNVTKRSVIIPKGGDLQAVMNAGNYIPYSTDNNKGFAGWSKSRDGKTVKLSKLDLKDDITLYAVWRKGDDIADGRVEMTGKRYTYTGRMVKPKITVYDRTGNKLKSDQYTVRYSDNIRAGRSYVTVRGKGRYSGTVTVPFTIHYDMTSKVKTVSYTGKNLVVKYFYTKDADGYTVHAVNKKTGREYTKDSKKTSAKIKNIPAGTYLVYVTPYVNISNDKNAKRVYADRSGNAVEKKVK